MKPTYGQLLKALHEVVRATPADRSLLIAEAHRLLRLVDPTASGHAWPDIPGGVAKDHAREKQPAVAYACLYQRLAAVAREHGYALAMHGSLVADLDLVAVPWTAGAVSDADLAAALAKAAPGSLHVDGWKDARPGGVRKHIIHLGGGPYIDLCVTPRLSPAPVAPPAETFEPPMGVCQWLDEGSDYTTECGHGWQFIDGGVELNDAKFCPFCGGKIQVVDERPAPPTVAQARDKMVEQLDQSGFFRPQPPAVAGGDAPPEMVCRAPAPSRDGRSCDKPRGHDGPHWTYGGHTLSWDAPPEIQVGDWAFARDYPDEVHAVSSEDIAELQRSTDDERKEVMDAIDELRGERHGQPFIWRRRQEGQ